MRLNLNLSPNFLNRKVGQNLFCLVVVIVSSREDERLKFAAKMVFMLILDTMYHGFSSISIMQLAPSSRSRY